MKVHTKCVRKRKKRIEIEFRYEKVCMENWFHYPFHSRVHIALASQLYDPPLDFERQMINPDCFVAHLDINKILPCLIPRFTFLQQFTSHLHHSINYKSDYEKREKKTKKKEKSAKEKQVKFNTNPSIYALPWLMDCYWWILKCLGGVEKGAQCLPMAIKQRLT